MSRTALLLIPSLLAACDSLGGSMDAGGMGANDLGVTPGGSQDIRLARDIIMDGGIPDQDAFTAEGLFSEHDLPLAGEDCDQVLCPRAAAASFRPVDDSGQQVLVQLGFGTNIDAATFERRALNLGVAVDISGSMTGDKLDAVKTALGVMIEQLDAGDTMALVAFDDRAELLSAPLAMDAAGRETMHRFVDRLRTDGSTNIAAGLELAFQQAAKSAGRSQVEDRVMLFTDEQPNTGNTSVRSFLELVQSYADQGIGLSAFGVGIDLGAELADQVSHVRGGACYYLDNIEAIEQVFDEDFDYLVSPVAYDLDVSVAPAEGIEFINAWGAPLDEDGEAVDFGTSTLFLSSRSGGMGVSLGGESIGAERRLAAFELSFETIGGESVSDHSEVTFRGGNAFRTEAVQADDVGVFVMAGLTDEYLALTAAAEFCDGMLGAEVAEARVAETAARLDQASAELAGEEAESAAGLDAESGLMAKLAENVAAGQQACR